MVEDRYLSGSVLTSGGHTERAAARVGPYMWAGGGEVIAPLPTTALLLLFSQVFCICAQNPPVLKGHLLIIFILKGDLLIIILLC